MSADQPKRLNKYISDTGFCSRREADKLIEQKRVTINDKQPELGTKVNPGDKVKVDGKVIGAVAEDKCCACHGCVDVTVCTTDSVHPQYVSSCTTVTGGSFDEQDVVLSLITSLILGLIIGLIIGFMLMMMMMMAAPVEACAVHPARLVAMVSLVA